MEGLRQYVTIFTLATLSKAGSDHVEQKLIFDPQRRFTLPEVIQIVTANEKIT